MNGNDMMKSHNYKILSIHVINVSATADKAQQFAKCREMA